MINSDKCPKSVGGGGIQEVGGEEGGIRPQDCSVFVFCVKTTAIESKRERNSK